MGTRNEKIPETLIFDHFCETCKFCKEFYGNRRIFEIHRKRFGCTCTCGKEFKSECEFQTHFRHSERSTPFKCCICLSCFRHNIELVMHFRRKHGDYRKYVCNCCRENLMNFKELAVHYDIYITGKLWECDKCHSSFVTGCLLRQHERQCKKIPASNIIMQSAETASISRPNSLVPQLSTTASVLTEPRASTSREDPYETRQAGPSEQTREDLNHRLPFPLSLRCLDLKLILASHLRSCAFCNSSQPGSHAQGAALPSADGLARQVVDGPLPAHQNAHHVPIPLSEISPKITMAKHLSMEIPSCQPIFLHEELPQNLPAFSPPNLPSKTDVSSAKYSEISTVEEPDSTQVGQSRSPALQSENSPAEQSENSPMERSENSSSAISDNSSSEGSENSSSERCENSSEQSENSSSEQSDNWSLYLPDNWRTLLAEIRNASPEQIREMFSISNDNTVSNYESTKQRTERPTIRHLQLSSAQHSCQESVPLRHQSSARPSHSVSQSSYHSPHGAPNNPPLPESYQSPFVPIYDSPVRNFDLSSDQRRHHSPRSQVRASPYDLPSQLSASSSQPQNSASPSRTNLTRNSPNRLIQSLQENESTSKKSI